MGAKRITIKHIHEGTGLSRTTIANRYHDKATRIDYDTLDTLDKLCTCFDVQPSQIFEYVPEEKTDA